MTYGPRAVVVAFDGLVVDTFAARTLAVVEALDAEGITAHAEDVASLVPGRSLDEAVEAVLHAAAQGAALDHTTRDLTVLRARRTYSAIVSQGLPLRPGAATWIEAQAASGARVVVRADSARVDTEPLLRLSGLADLIAFTRCADDLPRTRGQTSLRSAWWAIAARCAMLRIDVTSCRALEASLVGTAAAREHWSEVGLALSLTE